MYFKFVLAALVISANALTTPHGVRLTHHSRHVGLAKARAPAPAPEPAAAASNFVSKRGLKKRCKPRVDPSSLTLSSSAAATSAAPSIGAGIGNVGADPNSTTAPAPPESTKAPAKSTEAPAPAPSSSAAAPPPSPSPKPSPTSGGGSGGGSSGGNCDDLGAVGCTRTGQGTFYDTGLTACGINNNDSQFIAAVSEKLFDQFEVDGNPNHNKLCNRQAQVNFQGKSITVTITDRCTACQEFDLDFTPTAFQALGVDLGVGRISGVEWKFIS